MFFCCCYCTQPLDQPGHVFFAKCFTNINVFWLCPLYTATWCFLCFFFMVFAKYFYKHKCFMLFPLYTLYHKKKNCKNRNCLCFYVSIVHSHSISLRMFFAKCFTIIKVFLLLPLYTATWSARVGFLQNILQT